MGEILLGQYSCNLKKKKNNVTPHCPVVTCLEFPVLNGHPQRSLVSINLTAMVSPVVSKLSVLDSPLDP